MISVKCSLKANQVKGLFVNGKHKFADYNLGDELTIDGRWFEIVDIDDESIWMSDEDGGEHEFFPGTEDAHRRSA